LATSGVFDIRVEGDVHAGSVASAMSERSGVGPSSRCCRSMQGFFQMLINAGVAGIAVSSLCAKGPILPAGRQFPCLLLVPCGMSPGAGVTLTETFPAEHLWCQSCFLVSIHPA